MTTIRTKRPPDRVDRIRRLRWLFYAGMAIAGLGMLLTYVGSRVIVASSQNGEPLLENGLLLMGLGAFLIGPLGVGAILASAVGFVVVRGFSLRALLIATAVCGVLMGACVSLKRPWKSEHLEFAEDSGQLRIMLAPTAQSSNPATGNVISFGEIQIGSVYRMALIPFIIGGLPFLTLPLILKWRVRTRGPSPNLRTSVTSADYFAPEIQETPKPSTDVTDGRR